MEAPSGHVIVCGLNTLGFRIAEQLHLAGVPLVVVDDRHDAALARRLERWGVTFVAESSHASETLLDVGITQATALIACAGTDLANLETVLLAAELAPELRQVVAFANPQLGDQLRAAVPGVRVLSLSGKAGPSFVEACIRSDVLHAFRLDAETMQVVDVPVDQTGPFRQRYGNLTPISLRRGDQPPEVCPGRDTPVAPGDRLALLGRVKDFEDNEVTVHGQRDTPTLARLSSATEPAQAPAQPGRSPREWFADLRVTVSRELDRPFRIALIAVLSLIALSTLVLSLAYVNTTVLDTSGHPKSFGVLDALYFTVSTIATVGFGDYNFAPETGWLKVFGIGLIIVGVVSLSTVYAFITNVVVTRRLERTFGRGRATMARDHVIVCGFGSVGLAVAEGLLAAGRRVVVVESDENNRYLPVARSLGIPVVLGDATVRTTLEQAGLRRASTLAAMTSDDVANLGAVLSAREMFAHDHADGERDLRVVLRIFDTELADEIERRFGIHTARSASALAAPWFVGAALGYEVISTFYVDRQPFLVARMSVAPGGGLDGPALSDLVVGTRVFAYAAHPRPGAAKVWDYRPTRHTRLAPGDEVLVVGPAGRVITTFRQNQSAR